MTDKLSDVVKISPYYQRSVLINSDLDSSDAISGYVCHETAKKLLESMATQITHSNQRAFTWTGPFGTGKSILSLALASAIGSCEKQRVDACNRLETQDIREFDNAFPVTDKGWLVLPIVGTNASASKVLSETLNKITGVQSSSSRELLQNLSDLSDSSKYDGVLIVIDEMGKFLESSESAGDDIFFFQELAELSSRVTGNFVLIGILHQAFKQYARTQKLAEKTQNDWAKVQGRFVDLPFVTSADEVVKLIGNAIHAPVEIQPEGSLSELVCKELNKRRPAVSDSLAEALSSCWPLHPITTLLLGPVSKRQFGQNERSIFGFLGSLEPYGFQEFLRVTEAISQHSYTPEHYWDYLKANVEPAIISSLDSHRWSIAVEALERVEAKGEHFHASLLKSIAIIDLFKNGSGLAADNTLLYTIYPDVKSSKIDSALSELSSWKVIVYRKFNSAWSIFEGSDFDIEAAITQEIKNAPSLEAKKASEMARFYPIIAKRHLYQTGTSRWMGMAICDSNSLIQYIKNYKPSSGEFGQFIFLIDSDNKSLAKLSCKISELKESKEFIFALGVPDRRKEILELSREVIALGEVNKRPELAGDPVARKEVESRLSAVRNSLETELSHATENTTWVHEGKAIKNGEGNLSKLASTFADTLYSNTPRIHSELVNRDNLSTSSVKARKDLMYRMLSSEQQESLGIEGFPAEKGLYLTCLLATGIHKREPSSEFWCLSEPNADDRNLLPAWNVAIEMVTNESNSVSCDDIYKLWAAPPYGIKSGLMPILLWALILSNKDKLALYKEGYYLPDPTDLDIDVSLQNISKFELKGIELTEERLELLNAITDVIQEFIGAHPLNDALSVAKGLVRIVYGLPGWVKRTRKLPLKTMRFRDCILQASDPHKVLFHELQGIFKTSTVDELVEALRDSLSELTTMHHKLMTELLDLLCGQLNIKYNEFDKLRTRALNVKDTGKPLVNAFINRLVENDGSNKAILEIYGQLIAKSSDDWNDYDVQEAKNKLAVMSREFRELEVIASVNKRDSSREALAIVYGSSSDRDFVTRFDVFAEEAPKCRELSDEFVKTLSGSELSKDAQLAVLAQALEALKAGENHG